jgi:hypothetical protein
MKTKRLLAICGNIMLGAALLIVMYLLLDFFVLNPAPPGSCPLIGKRPLLYLAIGLSVFSLILSFFEQRKPGI